MAIMSVNKVFNTRRLIRVVVAVLVMVNLVYLVRYIGGRQVTDVVKEIIPAHRAADSKNKVTVDKMPETTSPVAENKKEVLVNDVFDDMVTFSPLDPQQVTSCKVDNNLRQIPHIIHQSWKTNTLPFRFLSWQKTWISKHPDWEYRLWTDADNLQLVEEHFPWFLETYKALPQNIHRADAVRYMYMYKFGGFYSDLDLEALKDHSGLANCGGLLVPLMSDDFNFVHNVPNAWIASVPNHPFWTFLLKNIQSRFSHDTGGVEGLTGPIMLYDTLKAYSQKPTLEPIKYVRPGLIFPYDWHNSNGNWEACSAQSDFFNADKCKSAIHVSNETYTITYWSHTWGDDNALANLDVDWQKSERFLPGSPKTVTKCDSGSQNSSHNIPHTIHQSWKTNVMPKVQQKLTQKFERWHKTWIKYNPEWEYKLWTDADNLKLVETDYAWFLETYNGFDRNIERADAVRYMYMHKLGGVYADLDVECLKPMDELTSCGGLIMPLMSDEYGFEHNVPNAWLASSPGHPFWIDMLKSIQASSKGGDAGSVESITGPVRLYHSLARYRQLPGEHAPIIYAKEGLIFPFDWHRSVKFAEFCSAQLDSFDDAACKAEIALVYPNAYSITYWSHSWGDDHSLANLDVEGSH